MQSIKELWREVSPNAKWDFIKVLGASMIGALGYLIHKFWHGLPLPDWTFGAILFVATLALFWKLTSAMHTVGKARTGSRQDSAIDKHLVIHSAIYGPEGLAGRDVTALLQRKQRCALSVKAANDSLGGDPAPNIVKRLEVEYSYGGNDRHIATTKENSRLTLPERDLIQASESDFVDDIIYKASKSASLIQYANEADRLNEMLETVWHHWDNCGLKLVRPLAERPAEQIQDWGTTEEQRNKTNACWKELHRFIHIYWHYLHVLRSESPEFELFVVASTDKEYLDVRRGLTEHAQHLRAEAQRLLSSAKGEL